MMSKATITLTDREGGVDLLAHYDGEDGFNADHPSHQFVSQLVGLMDELAQPVGERQNLTAADILKFTAAAQNNVALEAPASAG